MDLLRALLLFIGMWQLSSRSIFLALFDAFNSFISHYFLGFLISSSQVSSLLLTCSVGHVYCLIEYSVLKTNLNNSLLTDSMVLHIYVQLALSSGFDRTAKLPPSFSINFLTKAFINKTKIRIEIKIEI